MAAALRPGHAPISRPHGPGADPGCAADGPHRHRHAVGLRPPDALRSGPGFSRPDHQEAASALDHRRTALVPARRHQCPLAAGAEGEHLGRMGGRGGRPRPRLWQAVARLGDRGWPPYRPDRRADRTNPYPARLAPPDRVGLEPRRPARHGAGTVPLSVPDPCREWPPVAATLSALGRHLPGRAVQHRLLCPPHPYAGAAMRSGGGRVHLDRRRLPPVPQPSRTGAYPVGPGALPRLEITRKPDAIDGYALEDFVLHDYVAQRHIKAVVAI